MSDSTDGGKGRGRSPGDAWLGAPENQVQAELREALDHAAARDADEVALRRVWARVSQFPETVQMDRIAAEARAERRFAFADQFRGTRWPWIGAASLAGAAVAIALMLLGNTNARRSGSVALGTAAPAPAAGSIKRDRDRDSDRSVLVAPATVRTGSGETLRLALRGGTEVTVMSESTLVLDDSDRPSVATGEVQFHVPPQPPGRTFAVSAGAYRVVVVGTRFRVRVNGGNAAVGVDEGVVEIWTDHRLARLSAGESWVSPSAPGAQAENQRTLAPATDEDGATATRLAGGAREHRVPRATRVAWNGGSGNPRVGNGLASSGPVGSSGAASAQLPGGGDSLLSAPGWGDASPAGSSAAGSIGSGGTDTAATPGPEASIAPPPSAGPPAADLASLTAQARAARTSGEPRKALGLYRTLAQRGGAAGENAEYEIGRVLRDGLHQPREAVAAWRAYRTQHPRGLLRVEADISVIETLVALNDRSAALSEAADFVHRYPDSERRVEIGGLAGDLLRERGDFSGAISAYDAALGTRHGRRETLDAVSFHRSVCLVQDDRQAGLVALRAYLQSFPNGRFRAEAERLLAEQTRAGAARRE